MNNKSVINLLHVVNIFLSNDNEADPFYLCTFLLEFFFFCLSFFSFLSIIISIIFLIYILLFMQIYFFKLQAIATRLMNNVMNIGQFTQLSLIWIKSSRSIRNKKTDVRKCNTARTGLYMWNDENNFTANKERT